LSSEANTSPAAPAREEQRLDPEVIAGEDQPSRGAVVHREREHPAQACERGRTPVPPRFQQDLRIGARCEYRTAVLELSAELEVVVNLTVVDEHQAMLLERLVGCVTDVDDREPAMPQPHRHGCRGASQTRRIGPAMGQRTDHRPKSGSAIGSLYVPAIPHTDHTSTETPIDQARGGDILTVHSVSVRSVRDERPRRRMAGNG